MFLQKFHIFFFESLYLEFSWRAADQSLQKRFPQNSESCKQAWKRRGAGRPELHRNTLFSLFFPAQTAILVIFVNGFRMETDV